MKQTENINISTPRLNEFEDIVRAIGEPEFSARLFALLDSHLGLDHLIVDGFDIRLRPHRLFNQSENIERLLSIGKTYARYQMYSSDPVVHEVRELSWLHRGIEPVRYKIMRGDTIPSRYRKEVLKEFKLRERVVILFNFRAHWFALKMLREGDRPAMPDARIDALMAKYPTLLNVLGWHAMYFSGARSLSQLEAEERFERIVQNLGFGLSYREVQACAFALAGHTNKQSAEMLGVSANTLRTFRNRAYAKMGITNIQQLSSICLARIENI